MKYTRHSFLVVALLLSIPAYAYHDLSSDFAEWQKEVAPVLEVSDSPTSGLHSLVSDQLLDLQAQLENQKKQLREILGLQDNEYDEITGPFALAFEPYEVLLPIDILDQVRIHWSAMDAQFNDSVQTSMRERLTLSCKAIETELEKEFNLSNPHQQDVWSIDNFGSWFMQVDRYFNFVNEDDKVLYRAARKKLEQSVYSTIKQISDSAVQANQKVLDLFRDHEDAIRQHIKEHTTQEETSLL